MNESEPLTEKRVLHDFDYDGNPYGDYIEGGFPIISPEVLESALRGLKQEIELYKRVGSDLMDTTYPHLIAIINKWFPAFDGKDEEKRVTNDGVNDESS